MRRAPGVACITAALLGLAGCHGGSRSRSAGGAVRPETTVSATAPASSSTTVPARPAAGTAVPSDCPPPVPLQTDAGPVRGRSLAVVSAQKGFAVDDTHVVVTDDGRTWSRRWSGSEPMYSVEAVDADHAWAVGQNVLLATTDGGRTWNAAGEPATRTLRVVDFADAQDGWGVADAHVVRTTDGGRTWTLADPPCGGEAVCFTGADDGWAAMGPHAYRTVDGGRSWVPAFTVPTDGIDHPFTLESVHATQLECNRSGVVWALFTSRSSGSHLGYVAYRGTAAGQWTPVLKEAVAGPTQVSAPAGGTHPAPMASLGPDSALYVQFSPLAKAPDQLTLRAATAGGTRLGPAQPIPGLFTASSISFLSPDAGWVLGTKTGPATVDAILATTDGGRTWQEQYSNTLPGPAG